MTITNPVSCILHTHMDADKTKKVVDEVDVFRADILISGVTNPTKIG